MKLLIIQSSQPSCHFLLVRNKYKTIIQHDSGTHQLDYQGVSRLSSRSYMRPEREADH